MEENISRMAGSQHGVRLDPDQLIAAARAAGRTPAQRNTLYEIIETYAGDDPREAAAAAPVG
jgi:FO synthase